MVESCRSVNDVMPSAMLLSLGTVPWEFAPSLN
jgi:hypothetical protein